MITFFFDNDSRIPEDRRFTRKEIEDLLNAIQGKTLGEIDKCNIIGSAMEVRPDKVVRGVAGDVIEISVLGCAKDNRPNPDILVDGIETELKTTGVVKPNSNSVREYEAKEPLTITGVSPNTIISESFEESRFYHKIEHLLFVFYLYDLSQNAHAQSSIDYFNFPVLGHLFWEVPPSVIETLRNDWTLVKEFVRHFSFENEEERHKLKSNLMLIDYASPLRPRFRFKRTFVNSIVDTFLHKKNLSSLPKRITKYSEIDTKCDLFTKQYRGKTIAEINKKFGVVVDSKDACPRIIVKMFGGTAKSINQIKDFNEIGLIAKTIVLTSDGNRTEDMKMFQVDFDELLRPNVSFSEEETTEFQTEYSDMYSYFAEHSFIFMVFQEPYKPLPNEKIPLEKDIFIGFKRITFDDDLLNEAKRCWTISRNLIQQGKLREEKSGGGYAPNFPKSKECVVFFRGSGRNHEDRKKRLEKWGIDIQMYSQWIWIKGKYIVDKLNQIRYL